MKSRRKNLKISQAELAEKIGTAPNYISKIEAEKQFPSVTMIEKLAQALECDSVDLFSKQPLKTVAIENIKLTLVSDISEIISARLDALEG